MLEGTKKFIKRLGNKNAGDFMPAIPSIITPDKFSAMDPTKKTIYLHDLFNEGACERLCNALKGCVNLVYPSDEFVKYKEKRELYAKVKSLVSVGKNDEDPELRKYSHDLDVLMNTYLQGS